MQASFTLRNYNTPRMISTGLALLALSLALGMSGCGTTKQAREVQTSGFLKDSWQLKSGSSEANDPILVYINPEMDCKKYKSIILQPVTLWGKAENSSYQDLTEQERSMLTHEADKVLRETVENGGFFIVNQPGPDVMVVRAALTEAEKSNVLMKDITVVAPYVTGPAMLWSEAKGKALFTGEAAFELEILDSLSGQRLYAAADKRVGKLDPKNFHSWDDVKEAMKAWSERGVKRLVNCRTKGSFALDPKDKSMEDKLDKYMP